jgi:DNA-directed RNA polymerase subunit M/transcription elongation factor TFIIS
MSASIKSFGGQISIKKPTTAKRTSTVFPRKQEKLETIGDILKKGLSVLFNSNDHQQLIQQICSQLHLDENAVPDANTKQVLYQVLCEPLVKKSKEGEDTYSSEFQFSKNIDPELYKQEEIKITSKVQQPTIPSLYENLPSLEVSRINNNIEKDNTRNKSLNVKGIFKCPKCKSNRTIDYQLQTRSADEPMTAKVSCMDCGFYGKPSAKPGSTA